jgi:SAM-dependent methyltransferase
MSNCRSCGSSNVTTFLSLGTLPLADGLRRKEELATTESRYPLDVAFCETCSLVQILETVPPEELFCRDYPYYSSFSDTLLEHSRQNVESLIATRGLHEKSLVVELASNDGYLLQYFVERNIPVLGIDPAEGPARAAVEKGIPTLCSFFTREFAERLTSEGAHADVVIGNNVLAHVADLNGFVAGIGTILREDGVAVLEMPYVKDLIDHCEFDTIYHEHLCYFSVTALDKLFSRHGLSLNRVEHYPIHGGSLRIFVGKRKDVDETVTQYLARESAESVDRLDYFQDFASRVESIKKTLHQMLCDLRSRGHRVAGYGAAAKGAVLLNYARIGTDLLDFVVDRNVHKQGLFMPGVQIPIAGPAKLLEEKPDYVLLLAWNFKDEILRQQQAYRDLGGRFVVPIPQPEIV